MAKNREETLYLHFFQFWMDSPLFFIQIIDIIIVIPTKADYIRGMTGKEAESLEPKDKISDFFPAAYANLTHECLAPAIGPGRNKGGKRRDSVFPQLERIF
ncbi:MAG: hypothetical protein Q4G00_01150 [Clostridia bacterium]|nr:hypothetical protein [Clostridia bacterium]